MDKKFDRVEIRKLALEGYTDREIAELLGAKHSTISNIRRRELSLKKQENTLLLTQWRHVNFFRNSRDHTWNNSRIYLNNFLFQKMGFTIGDEVYFKTTFQAPNILILEFKKEEDIYDKERIYTKRRRFFRRPR